MLSGVGFRCTRCVAFGSHSQRKRTLNGFSFQSLRHLTITDFDEQVSPHLRQQLQPVLSSLTLVAADTAFASISDDVLTLIPLLEKVETLHLGSVDLDRIELRSPSTRRDQPPTLRRLRLPSRDGDFPSLFGLSLANLIALVLSSPSSPSLDPFSNFLPSFPNLQSLNIPFQTQELGDSLLAALPTTSLAHLRVGFWPTHALLSLFPTTVETLVVVLQNGDEEGLITRAEFEAVPRWRERYLPSLRSVVLQVRDGDEVPNTIEELVEIESRAEGFQLSIHQGYAAWKTAPPTVAGQ